MKQPDPDPTDETPIHDLVAAEIDGRYGDPDSIEEAS